ncbi:MAG: hypothetical protein QNJ97_01885 [Myxococcota bacterium]|nr:hypothetical protein [Myxococcota bacterium]
MPRWIKQTGAAGLTLILALTALRLGSLTAAVRERTFSEDARYYLPPAMWLRVFSLGYTEAAADLVWIKTIVAFGGQFDTKKEADQERFAMNYLATSVELDPRFRRLYTDGSALTLFQDRGIPSEKTVQMAIDLLERGTEIYPNDGEIFFNLGMMHYFEMRPFLSLDPDDPERIHHQEVGTRLISRAALMPGVPPYAARLSASLLAKDTAIDDFVIDHLKAMLLRETDPEVRRILTDKLRQELGKAVERDIATTEILQADWQQDLPFVPFDFYLMLRSDITADELRDPLAHTNQMLRIKTPEEPTPDGDQLLKMEKERE